jgi:hypothetical protein
MNDFVLPPTVLQGGRPYWPEGHLNHLLDSMVAKASGKPAPALDDYLKGDTRLVPLAAAAKRMGVSTKTLKRRIAAQRAQTEEAP